MDRQKIKSLLKLPLAELVSFADKIRRREVGTGLDLCSIMNAKSGLCAEDCKFCAQASRHSTGAATYPLKEKREIIKAAKRAKEIGAKRFGIVTSGDRLNKSELHNVADSISSIRDRVDIDICASLGRLDEGSARLLKRAGLARYHHNIETSPDYFPKIVTTHDFEDRIETIKIVKDAGLEVCSGVIIGLGETWRDRIDMALVLKELNVASVPINILVPIKGTPLGKIKPLSCADAIKTIAIFRIILKDKVIKLAAGRESVLKDFQAMAFMAGANGMLIGGYLTIKGRDIEEDGRLIKEIERTWKG